MFASWAQIAIGEELVGLPIKDYQKEMAQESLPNLFSSPTFVLHMERMYAIGRVVSLTMARIQRLSAYGPAMRCRGTLQRNCLGSGGRDDGPAAKPKELAGEEKSWLENVVRADRLMRPAIRR